MCSLKVQNSLNYDFFEVMIRSDTNQSDSINHSDHR